MKGDDKLILLTDMDSGPLKVRKFRNRRERKAFLRLLEGVQQVQISGTPLMTLPDMIEKVRDLSIDELWVLPSSTAFFNLRSIPRSQDWVLRRDGLPGVKVYWLDNSRRPIQEDYLVKDFIAFLMNAQGASELYFSPSDRKSFLEGFDSSKGKAEQLLKKMVAWPSPFTFESLTISGSWEHGDVDFHLIVGGKRLNHANRHIEVGDFKAEFVKDFEAVRAAESVENGFERIAATNGDLEKIQLWAHNYSKSKASLDRPIRGQVSISLNGYRPMHIPFELDSSSSGNDFPQRMSSKAWVEIDLLRAVPGN